MNINIKQAVYKCLIPLIVLVIPLLVSGCLNRKEGANYLAKYQEYLAYSFGNYTTLPIQNTTSDNSEVQHYRILYPDQNGHRWDFAFTNYLYGAGAPITNDENFEDFLLWHARDVLTVQFYEENQQLLNAKSQNICLNDFGNSTVLIRCMKLDDNKKLFDTKQGIKFTDLDGKTLSQYNLKAFIQIATHLDTSRHSVAELKNELEKYFKAIYSQFKGSTIDCEVSIEKNAAGSTNAAGKIETYRIFYNDDTGASTWN